MFRKKSEISGTFLEKHAFLLCDHARASVIPTTGKAKNKDALMKTKKKIINVKLRKL